MKKMAEKMEKSERKLKIVILHHDIEPAELKFKELFEQKGCLVDFIDIRTASEEEFLNYDFVFNRVYTTVAAEDFKVLNKTLCLLKDLEEKGINCVNSFKSSLADYNKFELFNLLSSFGIPTPPTIFIGSKHSIKKCSKKAIKEFDLPIVIKRNCGGKSYQVTRAHSFDESVKILEEMFDLAEEQNYHSGFVLQKFVKPLKDHDCRVGAVNGEFIFSYARSYTSRNSEDKWISSTSNGSYEFPYSATQEEQEVAIKANLAIDSFFSESDVILTENGPFIIEVNPTPGYFVDSLDDIERMEKIVEKIINSVKPKIVQTSKKISEEILEEIEVYN